VGDLRYDPRLEAELEKRIGLVAEADHLTEPLDRRDYLKLLIVTVALPVVMLLAGWWWL